MGEYHSLVHELSDPLWPTPPQPEEPNQTKEPRMLYFVCRKQKNNKLIHHSIAKY